MSKTPAEQAEHRRFWFWEQENAIQACAEGLALTDGKDWWSDLAPRERCEYRDRALAEIGWVVHE